MIACVLALDRTFEVLPTEEHQPYRPRQHGAQCEDEPLLALFTQLLPPREQVDTRHQSKLLMASPHAIIKAGASLASAPAFTLLLNAISAKGLATKVWVPSFC